MHASVMMCNMHAFHALASLLRGTTVRSRTLEVTRMLWRHACSSGSGTSGLSSSCRCMRWMHAAISSSLSCCVRMHVICDTAFHLYSAVHCSVHVTVMGLKASGPCVGKTTGTTGMSRATINQKWWKVVVAEQSKFVQETAGNLIRHAQLCVDIDVSECRLIELSVAALGKRKYRRTCRRTPSGSASLCQGVLPLACDYRALESEGISMWKK